MCEALGFEVETQRFVFPANVLVAFPAMGAGLGWVTILLIPLLALPSVPAAAALGIAFVALAALALVGWGLGSGRARMGGEVREDANLVVRRPGATPSTWLVAHVDTKAQGHSMAGRLVAVWLVLAAVGVLLLLSIWRLWAPVPVAAIAASALLSLGAGVLAGRGRLRGRTVGARDNGSGLVALLAAAPRLPPTVGLLFTSAEEFGVVGARILAERAPELLRGSDVINIDTVDDTGALFIVSHDRNGATLARELAPVLQGLALRCRTRRLPLGILVDSLPLARAGARAVTLARLDWSSLRALHTPQDTGFPMHTARALGDRVGRWLADGARAR